MTWRGGNVFRAGRGGAFVGAGTVAALCGAWLTAAPSGCFIDSNGIGNGFGGGTSSTVSTGGAASSSTTTASSGGAASASASVSSSTSTTSTSTVSSTSSSGGPDCATGFTCVPSISVGEYAVEAPGGGQPCPTGWGVGANYTDGADPGCNACTCGAPVGAQCFPPAFDIHDKPDCSDPIGNTVADTSCFAVDPQSGAMQLGAGAPPQTIAQGSCSPAAGQVAAKAPVETTVCTVPSAGAGTCHNQPGTCVPESGGAFGKTCVVLAAPATCPTGWESPQTLKPLTGDTRTCSCSCGAASGATCAGAAVDFYASATCTPAPDQVLVPGNGCLAITIPGGYRSFISVPGTLQAGTCAAQTNEAGMLVLGGDQTICCLP